MTLRILPILAVLALGLLSTLSLARAQVKGPAPYVSESQDLCISEMAKDPNILAACKIQYSNEFHELDAKQVVKNHRFVVAAYAAIWGLLAVLVGLMWIRQRRLSQEISLLEAELKRVSAE